MWEGRTAGPLCRGGARRAPLPHVVKPNRFADSAVRQAIEPEPAAELRSSNAVHVLADGDPAVRAQPGADRLARRKAERVEISDGHDGDFQIVDVQLARDGAEALGILSPIEIAVDEPARRLSPGERVEVG